MKTKTMFGIGEILVLLIAGFFLVRSGSSQGTGNSVSQGNENVQQITISEQNLNYYSSIDYSCQTDSDCEIKNVGNCCGYYPRCVNKNYLPDVESVVKECKEKGVVSICGFPDVAGCKCIENKCNSIEGSKVV